MIQRVRRPSHKMQIALIRQQLRGRHVLDRDRIMRAVSDDGVAGCVVMSCRQQRTYVRKYAVAELKRVGCRRKV